MPGRDKTIAVLICIVMAVLTVFLIDIIWRESVGEVAPAASLTGKPVYAEHNTPWSMSVKSPSAKEAMLELEDLSSPIGAFIRDRCIIGPTEEVEVAYLFEIWTQWCTEQNRDRKGTRQMFGRDLRAAVPHIKTSNIREGIGRKRLYQGIGLK